MASGYATEQDILNGKLDLDTVAAVATSLQQTTTDRLGNTKLTLTGAFDKLGFFAPVSYTSGVTVTTSSYTVMSGGNMYFAKPDVLPFTTAVSFDASKWKMFNEEFAGAEMGRLANYLALRTYLGGADVVTITDTSIAGQFNKTNRVGAIDNSGTVIIANNGDVWERVYNDPVMLSWFESPSAQLQAAVNIASGRTLVINVNCTTPSTVIVTSNTLIVIDPSVTVTYTGTDSLFKLVNNTNTFVNGYHVTGGTIKSTGGGSHIEDQKSNGSQFDSIIFDGAGTSKLKGTKFSEVRACQFINGATIIHYAKTGLTAANASEWGESNKVIGCLMNGAFQGFQCLYQRNMNYSATTASNSTSTYGCGFVIEFENVGVDVIGCYAFGHVRSGFYVEGNVAYGVKDVNFISCHGYANGEAGIATKSCE